jgi:hypothetical protein
VWESGKWIEIYNAGGIDVAVNRLKLGSNAVVGADIQVRGACDDAPDVMIGPKGYAVVYIGQCTAAGGMPGDLTCNISFNTTTDAIYLDPPEGWPWPTLANGSLDVVSYKKSPTSSPPWPVPPAGFSLGRVDDGGDTFASLTPTPGATNKPQGFLFIRGDCNEDGVLDETADPNQNVDFLALRAYLTGGPSPQCLDRLDINDDGAVGISDLNYFLHYFFYADEPSLPPPFPDPGPDPTADELPCA